MRQAGAISPSGETTQSTDSQLPRAASPTLGDRSDRGKTANGSKSLVASQLEPGYFGMNRARNTTLIGTGVDRPGAMPAGLPIRHRGRVGYVCQETTSAGLLYFV